MDYDLEKVDEAVLAVLYLTIHERVRARRGVDWDAFSRLHEKVLIDDPVGKQKSVLFTEADVREADRCFRELIGKK